MKPTRPWSRLSLVAWCAFFFWSLALLSSEETPTDGKAAFLAQKCNVCHAVSSAGIEATTKSEKMKGPDLKGKVAARGLDWTRRYLLREELLEGKRHTKEYKGTAEDLERILAWLEQQR